LAFGAHSDYGFVNDLLNLVRECGHWRREYRAPFGGAGAGLIVCGASYPCLIEGFHATGNSCGQPQRILGLPSVDRLCIGLERAMPEDRVIDGAADESRRGRRFQSFENRLRRGRRRIEQDPRLPDRPQTLPAILHQAPLEIVRNKGETLAGSFDRSGSSFTTDASVSLANSPANARWPLTKLSMSNSTAPKEKMSQRRSAVLPTACSGDTQAAVPESHPLVSAAASMLAYWP
jgi:hypothetical protein